MTNFITLNNGYQIPQLGFGTIQQFGKQIEDNVAFALNHGYQLIDTANRYENEVEVGKGLKLSGLKREYYFLETKLGPTLYENSLRRFSLSSFSVTFTSRITAPSVFCPRTTGLAINWISLPFNFNISSACSPLRTCSIACLKSSARSRQ